MREKRMWLCGLLLALGVGLGVQAADWTVLVYLDGDNSLDPFAVKDMNEMERVGSSDSLNIIVLVDRLEEGAKLYRMVQDNTDAIVSPVLEDWGEVNMGDPATLQAFLDYGMANFPAARTALVLWDHGGGWLGVCWDDHDLTEDGVTDRLTLDEVQQAIGSRYVDMLGFDACLMAMAETAYEFRNQAGVMVASEDSIPGDGWPYDTVLAGLAANPGWTGADLGAWIVDAYMAFYGFHNKVTLSTVDLARSQGLLDAINELAAALMAHMERGVVLGAQGSAEYVGAYGQYYAFIDLAGFADYVASHTRYPGTRSAALSVANEARGAVLSEAHGFGSPGATGLSIFLPVSPHYYKEVYGTGLDFTADSLWDEFVTSLYKHGSTKS